MAENETADAPVQYLMSDDLARRVEAIIGDYVDLSDRRYAQMMKFVRKEIGTPSVEVQFAGRPRCGVIGWPPLKKAIWDEVIAINLNGRQYISAWEVTDRIYAAAVALTEGSTA